MIIKLEKIISCSSEHPSYPASNLLQYNSNKSWRCAKPGEMLATVIFQLVEPSTITGVDIGNYRSCVVVVTASTSSEPDNWVPVVNHQFLTHDEAVNGKFRDQVQLFTKKELNPETIKIKFDRVKVTCMQSANLKELFGLTFITLRTEVVVDIGLDAFGRFKLKENKGKTTVELLREKYFKMVNKKKTDYKSELLTKIKESGMSNFNKRQEEEKEPRKKPLLEKLEAGKADEVFGKNKTADNSASKDKTSDKAENASISKDESNSEPVKRTPFGDVVPSTPTNAKAEKQKSPKTKANSKKRSLSPKDDTPKKKVTKKKQKCANCQADADDTLCKACIKQQTPNSPKKPTRKRNARPEKSKKPLEKLMEDVVFSLSGYVNPQRDEIRRKALNMGARYIADPNTTDKQCTHLICAFKRTPKYQQLKGHAKIVSHEFVEDCYKEKRRFPWRRYALDSKEKAKPESEEEIEGTDSPPRGSNPFDVDTDPESDH